MKIKFEEQEEEIAELEQKSETLEKLLDDANDKLALTGSPTVNK